MADKTDKKNDEATPKAVSAATRRQTIEIPKVGKVRLQSLKAPGLVLGDYKGHPVHVTVPVNRIAEAPIGETVDVTFQEVVEGHAVEAFYCPGTVQSKK